MGLILNRTFVLISMGGGTTRCVTLYLELLCLEIHYSFERFETLSATNLTPNSDEEAAWMRKVWRTWTCFRNFSSGLIDLLLFSWSRKLMGYLVPTFTQSEEGFTLRVGRQEKRNRAWNAMIAIRGALKKAKARRKQLLVRKAPCRIEIISPFS